MLRPLVSSIKSAAWKTFVNVLGKANIYYLGKVLDGGRSSECDCPDCAAKREARTAPTSNTLN